MWTALALAWLAAQQVPEHAAPEPALARALDWLAAETADAEAWADVAPSAVNAAAKRQVVDALIAWLLLVCPEHPAPDAWSQALEQRVESIAGGAGIVEESFANWLEGFAGIYAAERELAHGDAGPLLARLAGAMCARQNREGGWDHGAVIDPSFYPSTLIATSNLALFTLGMARRAGIDLEPQCVDDALALYADVQCSNGAMPYGGRPYRKGPEAGRTAGTVLALAALGLAEDESFGRAARYLLRNLASVPDGHASPAFHVFIGALATELLGGAAQDAYDQAVLARVRAAQAADGSFEDVVPGSPDSLRLMSDELTSRAYVTALYAAALAAPRSRLVQALRANPPAAEAPAAAPAPELPTLWSASCPDAEALCLGSDLAMVVRASGRVELRARTGGAPAGEVDAAEALGGSARGAEARLDGTLLVVWSPPRAPATGPRIEPAVETRSAEPGRLVVVDLERRAVAWSRDLPAPPEDVAVRGDELHVSLVSGRIAVLARGDGRELRSIPRPGAVINAPSAALDGGRLALASETRLELHSPGRFEPVWSIKNRARGLTPAAWTALAAGGSVLFAGRSDGILCALDPTDGRERWSLALGSAVGALRALQPGERVLVLCGDGLLRLVERGAVRWTHDADLGSESLRRAELSLADHTAWVASAAAHSLTALDVETGAPVGRTGFGPDDRWSASDRNALVWSSGSLRLVCVP